MNLRQLECACAIWRNGSVSGAAREMGISQQALSKALKSLEDELGLRLFLRSASGMIPTPQTILILEDAQNILFEINLLKSAAEHQRPQGSPKIVVGMVPGLLGGSGAPIVIDDLLDYAQGIFRNTVEIREAPTPLLSHQVQMGATELAFVCDAPPARCNGEIILSSPMKAVVSDSSPLRERDTVHWSDLRDMNIVYASNSRHVLSRIREQCLRSNFEPRFIPPVAQFDGNLGLAHANDTVFLCHDEQRVAASKSQSVRVLHFPQEEQVHFNLYLIWNENYTLTEPCFKLRDYVKEILNQD